MGFPHLYLIKKKRITKLHEIIQSKGNPNNNIDPPTSNGTKSLNIRSQLPYIGRGIEPLSAPTQAPIGDGQFVDQGAIQEPIRVLGGTHL